MQSSKGWIRLFGISLKFFRSSWSSSLLSASLPAFPYAGWLFLSFISLHILLREESGVVSAGCCILCYVFLFGLDKCQVPIKTTLSLPLLNWTEERKYDERLEGRDKDRERTLTNYCHEQNRLNLEKKESLIYHLSNQSRIVRNKSRS